MSRSTKTSTVIAPALRRALLRFFTWWRGELALLVPAKIRHWWRARARAILLRLTATDAIFERIEEGGSEQILTINLGNGGLIGHRTEMDQSLSKAMRGIPAVTLCLHPEQVLQRTIFLPLAVEENLRQTLTFELDRFTPFKPDQVHFDSRIVDRDPVQRRLTVELAVVKRLVFDQELHRASALGVRIERVTVMGGVVGPSDYFNFLPATARMRKPSHNLRVRLGLLLGAGFLLVVLLAIPIWQKRATAISLLGPLAEAKVAAMEADQRRERLEKLAAEYNFLLDRKWGGNSTLRIVEELTKILNDDTYVNVLEFDRKTVQIQGESGSASTMIELLEASPMFKDVAFKAQLTKMQGIQADRFHIMATLEDDARPKPEPVDTKAADKGSGIDGPPLSNQGDDHSTKPVVEVTAAPAQATGKR
jgi:general secretion pathway protein L